MWNSFRNWYIRNHLEITWFLIGFMTLSCVYNLTHGHYVSAALDAFIVYVNYTFRKAW